MKPWQGPCQYSMAINVNLAKINHSPKTEVAEAMGVDPILPTILQQRLTVMSAIVLVTVSHYFKLLPSSYAYQRDSPSS